MNALLTLQTQHRESLRVQRQICSTDAFVTMVIAGTTTAMKHHTRSRKAPRQRQSAVGWSSLPKVDEVDASGEIQEGISPTGVSDRDGVDVAWAQTADAADIRYGPHFH